MNYARFVKGAGVVAYNTYRASSLFFLLFFPRHLSQQLFLINARAHFCWEPGAVKSIALVRVGAGKNVALRNRFLINVRTHFCWEC